MIDKIKVGSKRLDKSPDFHLYSIIFSSLQLDPFGQFGFFR